MGANGEMFKKTGYMSDMSCYVILSNPFFGQSVHPLECTDCQFAQAGQESAVSQHLCCRKAGCFSLGNYFQVQPFFSVDRQVFLDFSVNSYSGAPMSRVHRLCDMLVE